MKPPWLDALGRAANCAEPVVQCRQNIACRLCRSCWTRAKTLRRVAEPVLFLASGKADALSGRLLSVDEDVEEIVRRTLNVRRDDSVHAALAEAGVAEAIPRFRRLR
jgi:hypothetical protein